MKQTIRILILENQPADAELMLRELRRAGYEPEWKQVATEPDFLAQFDQGWEIILADCQMPQFTGLRALELLKTRGLDIPLILISGTAGEDLAVQGMKAGANNYLLKDHLARLGQVVKRELQDAAARGAHHLERVALKLSEFSILHSSLPTYWIAGDSRILRVNEAGCNQLGYTEAELLNLSVADIDPDFPMERWPAHRQDLRARRRMIFETRHRHKEGRIFPVEVDLNWFEFEGREYHFAFARDLTARKQAETELEQERNLLRTLIDHIPDMIYVRDRANRFLTANQSFARRMGVATAADLIGKTDADFYPPELAAQYAARDKKIFAGDELLNYDCVIPFPNGEHLNALNTKVPLKNAQGEVIGIVGVSHDLTERKQMEQALRESEAFYHSLVDQMPAGVFRKGPDGRFLFVSPGYCRLKGMKAEEFLGKTPKETAAEKMAKQEATEQAVKYVAQGEDHHRQIMETGRPIDVIEEYATANGGKQFLHAIKIPVKNADGKIIGTQGILFDITKQKQAELALANEQALLRTLTDNLPLAVYMKDNAGRKILTNPVDLQNQGVTSAAEVLGKTDFDIFPPEQAAAFHVDDQHVFDTGQPVLNRVEKITRLDGLLRWFLTSKVPLRDATGKVTGLAGFGLDITEQKQAELALANERALLHSLVENLPLAVYMKDLAGRKTMANPVDLYNQGAASEAEILGKTDFDFFPPEQAAAFHADDQQVLDGQPIFNREEKLTRPDGSVLWLLTSKVPLRDATGNVTGLAGFGLDITERKNIAEAHDQLALAVEQSAETIMITDRGGTILYTNPAFEKSSGYTRGEALGQNTRMLKSGKQDPNFYRRMWEVLERGEVWTGHFINKRKDGKLYEEEATISPIRDAAGQIINYVAVKRDVTREVQLDAQLRQSQKMEAIGQLAGGVAHDFNNILAIIQMQASLLKNGGPLSAEQLEMAEEIGNTVERAAALTRQLLLFSRREALQMRDLDLSAAITNLTKMLRRVLGENITVQINLSAEPMFIHADAGMMEQVLLNLAVNARDAMLNGGQLVISTAGVEFDELSVAQSPSARRGSFVCLNVADTGGGIPPEILPRIFEPFFTTKDVGKGTGLGLATVFGIVQRHEGWINVYSEVGQGTTFKIYLPRLVGLTARNIAEKMLATPPTGQETILLVEDETALRDSVRKILARLGYRILEAPNGVQALEVWKEHHAEIRLLLTDLVMPEGMSGKELAQRLLRENPGLKVIYMSGYSAELAGHDLSLQEGTNFLAKPFQMQILAQTIRNRLDQSG